MKTFNFGFFRIDQPIADQIQDKLIEFAKNPRPLDKTRTATIDNDTPVLLRNIVVEEGGAFLLDFTKIKDVPNQPVSDLAGNEETISFHNSEKRPADYTSALFDQTTRVVVIHEHSYGLSHAMIGKYWEKMIPKAGKFSLAPIINEKARDRLIQAGAISKFSVKLASMGDAKLIESLGLSQNHAMAMIDFFRAPNITITMELDSKKPSKSLNGKNIKELAMALMRLDNKHLKKLSLVAEDEAGDAFPIDLIKDRMVHKETLECKSTDEITDEIRYNATRSGWGERRSELQKRYAAAE